MNGPEHYRTAEILLANLRDEITGLPGTPLRTREQQAQMVAEAQVHATLALVAATIDAAEVDDYSDGGLQHVTSPSEIRNWREVTA